MKLKLIFAVILLLFTVLNAISQGHYFNIDKEQVWDSNHVSIGIRNVKLTYLFDFGNKKIIERDDISGKFYIYDVLKYIYDEIENKEIWSTILPNQDTMFVLIDFTESTNHNITLLYYQKNITLKNSMWHHAEHYRDFSIEQAQEFINNLYK